MRFPSRKVCLCLAGLLVLTVGAIAAARVGADDGKTSASARFPEGIPKAALETEEGRVLAEELRHLRRTEASLGAKHPSRESVREKIAAIEEKLQAWVAAPEGDEPLAEALPNMNAAALQHLILQMAGKIERLERRVDRLEKQLEVY